MSILTLKMMSVCPQSSFFRLGFSYRRRVWFGGVHQIHTSWPHYQTQRKLTESREEEIVRKRKQIKSKVKTVIEVMKSIKDEQAHNLNYSALVQDRQNNENTVDKPSWISRAITREYWAELWIAIKHEVQHYKTGFKLLYTDIRIAFRYLRQAINGEPLTRRQRKQFVRTIADMFRVLPFSAFIIIPAGELALPFFIKFFPNMLPTQFRHADSEIMKERGRLRVKLEMAKFLQETIDQMALERKDKSDEELNGLAEVARFFEEGRTSATDIPVPELLKFSKLFDNVLTLDSLSHAQLVALCRLLQLPTFGTSEFLNLQLRMKVRELKADDLLILKEGVDSLSVAELQDACTARGMRALGISEEKLKSRLKQWLQLHIEEEVPTSLLLMSRVLYLPDNMAPTKRIATVLDSLPENIKDEVRLQAALNEAKVPDPAAILAVLENEEKKIAEEIKEAEKMREIAAAEESRKLSLAALALAGQELLLRQPGEEFEQWHKYLEMKQAAKKRKLESQETKKPEKATDEDAYFTEDELRECLTHILQDNVDMDAFNELKEEILDRKVDYEALASNESEISLKVSPGTRVLMKRVSKMVEDIEDELTKALEIDKDSIVLDKNGDGVVSTEELVFAFKKLPWPQGQKPKTKRLRSMARCLDADGDGTVNIVTLQKILSLATSESGRLDFHALKAVVEMVAKEELINHANINEEEK
eukprot:m.164499 g.164499  ORF g.164499 m.164499 type:complete len:706 (-) comp15237_c0_seq1:277-2394(-)